MSYIEVSNPSVRRAMLIAKHVDHPKPPPIKIEIVDINEREISELKAQLEAQIEGARLAAQRIEYPDMESTVSVERIMKVVAKFYDVTVGLLKSECRTQALVMPRHIAMYLARKLTCRSFPDISRRIGNRDHTVGMHAFRKIEARRTVDPKLASDLEQLEKELTQ